MFARFASLLRPRAKESCLQIQARNLRPKIKISKLKFTLSIDVHQFNRDEICVKARPEYLLIQGKQERPTADGYIIRKFVKKIKLPSGCDPSRIKSKLSDDGILTITAMREPNTKHFPIEARIPITFQGPKKITDEQDFMIPDDPCREATEEAKMKKRSADEKEKKNECADGKEKKK